MGISQVLKHLTRTRHGEVRKKFGGAKVAMKEIGGVKVIERYQFERDKLIQCLILTKVHCLLELKKGSYQSLPFKIWKDWEKKNWIYCSMNKSK